MEEVASSCPESAVHQMGRAERGEVQGEKGEAAGLVTLTGGEVAKTPVVESWAEAAKAEIDPERSPPENPTGQIVGIVLGMGPVGEAGRVFDGKTAEAAGERGPPNVEGVLHSGL